MQQLATITSKMQFTIPQSIARKVGVKSGEKVQVVESGGQIIITPLKKLVEELAGSLAMPTNWREKDIDSIIEQAKAEYFQSKKV